MLCLFLLLAIIPMPSQGIGGRRNCHLPESFSGKWFENGERDGIKINSKNITHKGLCISKQGERYIFKDPKEQCYRCVVMHQKHKNVLQYKESLCETNPGRRGDPFHLCYSISADSELKSLFRLDAKPESCPVQGAFQFSYSRGHGLCHYPKSSISQCSDPSKLVFRYQACADIKGSESTVESVQCLAQWKEGSTYYFLGLINHDHVTQYDFEGRYRCFAYQEIYEGFKLSQSGDATCTLHSAIEGDRTMTLKRMHNHQKQCTLPSWMMDHHHTFHNLNESVKYQFNTMGTSLTIKNSIQQEAMKLKCNIIEKDTGNFTRIIMQVNFECESGFVCLEVTRKSESILKIRQGRLSRNPEEACNQHLFFDTSIKPTTIVSAKHGHRERCPLVGKYTLSRSGSNRMNQDQTGSECRPGQDPGDHLMFGCSGETSFDVVLKSCQDSQESVSSYTCHGGWVEGDDGAHLEPLVLANGLSSGASGQSAHLAHSALTAQHPAKSVSQYVVVSAKRPKQRSGQARRFCVRLIATDRGSMTVSLEAGTQDCPEIPDAFDEFSGQNNNGFFDASRISADDEDLWKFNLTRISECAKALATANEAPSTAKISPILTVILTLLLSISFLVF